MKFINTIYWPETESEEADAAESMLTLTRYSSGDKNVLLIDEKK